MRVLLLWLVLLTLPVAAVCWHWRVLEGSVATTPAPDTTGASPDHLVLLLGGQATSLRGANLLVGTRRDADLQSGPRLAQVRPASSVIASAAEPQQPPVKEPPVKDPPAKEPRVKEPPARKPPAAATPPAPRTTVLGDGETLYRVASRELGDGGRWREIAKLNRIAESSVGRIKAGARLELPRR